MRQTSFSRCSNQPRNFITQITNEFVTSLSQHQKQKAAERHQRDPAKKMTSNLAQVLKAKKMARRIGKLSTTEQAKLEKMYTSGSAAYGSARNLQEASKKPKAKIDTFLQQ